MVPEEPEESEGEPAVQPTDPETGRAEHWRILEATELAVAKDGMSRWNGFLETNRSCYRLREVAQQNDVV